MKTKISLKKVGVFALLCCNSLFFTTFGQTINSNFDGGTATTDILPIRSNYGYNYTQMIYFKSEMNVAIQNINSKITKLRFYNINGQTTNAKDWVIFLGHTTNSTFATNTSWIPLANLTEVFNGDISPLVTGPGWFEITLTTPFIYNGTDNLVLAVDENTSSYSSNSFRQHSANSTNRSINFNDDYSNPNPNSPPTASTRLNYVAQTIFVHEPLSNCAGTPSHSTVSLSPSTICAGQPAVLTYNQPDFASNFQYIWQKFDGTNWINIDTTTTTQYTIQNQPTTTNFRAAVTCLTSQLSNISDDATLNVTPKPTVTTNLSDVTVCDGSSIGLIANGATTYSWSPATNLNNTNTNNVNATVTTSRTYQVIGTTNGCMDTATVSVKLLSEYNLDYTTDPLNICTAGSPVTLALTNQNTLSNNGTWEYQFVSSTGAVLQDWSIVANYLYTPTVDSVYTVYYKFRSTDCPTLALDSFMINTTVGFGADVTIEPYDCINLGGSATLENYFGQQSNSIIYTNPLSVDSPSILISGSASYTSNRLVLTSNIASQNGKAIITTPTPVENNFTIEFNMTADQVYQPYGTGGADGISYSFGNDVSSSSANPHNGSGSKLRISFDAAENSSNLTGIYVVYGKTNTNAPTPTEATTLAYIPNLSSWKTKTDVAVSISITNGLLLLKIDNVILLNNVALPASYLTEDVSTWKHYFGALTGGDAMRQAISGLKIHTNSLKFGISSTQSAPTVWQDTPLFNALQPGTYSLWLAQSETGCNKNVQTITILNDNPIVNLGNDTTICQGESVTLDAEHIGASYVWSNSSNVTSTHTVSTAGNYYVQVTNPNGCIGMDAIQVTVLAAPTVQSINTQISYGTAYFTLLNVTNTSSVDWDFGDGHTLQNATATVSHVYDTKGPFTVTATVNNQCGSANVTTPVVIAQILAINETDPLEGLTVYPNPADHQLTISTDLADPAFVTILDAQGRVIVKDIQFTSTITLPVSEYNSGMYFLHITSNEKKSVVKITIK